MLKHRRIHSSPIVDIMDVECTAPCLTEADEERSLHDAIVFPRTGTYIKHRGRDELVADPNRLVFFNRMEPYRVTHPVGAGDSSTSLIFPRAVLREAFEAEGEAAGRQPVFRLSGCAAGTGLFLQLQTLRRGLLSGSTGGLPADEIGLDLLRSIAAQVRSRLELPAPRTTAAAGRRRREIVRTAQILLGRRYREPLSLAEIADHAGCSPYHLMRVFRSETGTSVHRYLDRLRLRESLERLCSGEDDLTALALDLGYSSHSHFTDSFRRAFGIPPSRFRESRIPEA